MCNPELRKSQKAGFCRSKLPQLMAAGIVIASSFNAPANGIYRDGSGARAMALGGASVGLPDQPLEALAANPAGLSLATSPTLQLGAVGAVVQGRFSNAANTNSGLRESAGALPEAAFVYPLKSVPVSLGLAVIPDALASVDWRFVDAPGGADGNTSYGRQRHHAEIIAIRTALGASVKINDHLSFGAALGIEYNRNTLIAPYTFQSHPALRGSKTLLDLQTDGWGVNGNFGLVWRPCDKVSVGVSYRTATDLVTDGDASGNANTQFQNLGAPFSGFRPDFHYEARAWRLTIPFP